MGSERAIGRRRGTALALAAALSVLPALLLDGASSSRLLPGGGGPELAYAAADAPCGGEPMPDPDRVVSGEFGEEIEGSSVFVPFRVPASIDGDAVSAIRVKYCFDQPDVPTNVQFRHTLDLGLYAPRAERSKVWGPRKFRGWGGSSHPDVTLSADGSKAADGGTTRAFLPGPIKPGRWAAELGVASVISQALGDFDGKVAWRVEIDYLTERKYADEPYRRTPCEEGGRCSYDRTPADSDRGWYAGDFHVHGEYSALNDAPLEEVLGYAFCPDPALGAICSAEGSTPGADLDFITLSDYVGGSQWSEVGRHQADYPGHLIVRSAEIITYEGHANAHAYTRHVDYRTGPLLRRARDGSLTQLRGPRDPSSFLRRISESRGPAFTQINHPTIFPSLVFDSFCRGCPWDYSAEETDYSAVDAIEIATGPAGLQADPEPGPNPFTPLAIQFWEDAIDADGINSHHIAAVGSSDSHNAGRSNNPITQAPIGMATTVVKAPELSERGIQRGVLAGHTYVKIWGADGPDLRLRGVSPAIESGLGSQKRPAIIGDTIEAGGGPVEFRATVSGLDRAREARPGIYSLQIFRNGSLVDTAPIGPGDRFIHEFSSSGSPARYRLQVMRDPTTIEAVSSPIYVE